MIEEYNEPKILAEVRAVFESYNAALDAGDTETLNGFFWNSSSTVRFGPGENLFGYDEITSFRSLRWKSTDDTRKTERVAITAFSNDLATTNAVFHRVDGAISRQSQTWARLPEGWRIVAAHVSNLPA